MDAGLFHSHAKQFSSQTAPGGSRCKPAFACFTQRGGHRVADALHGDDDLVSRNGARHAGKRQLGGGEGVGDAGRIAFDAGDFHQPCDGVADKPKDIFQRDGDSVRGHLRRASRQLHKRGGRQRCGGAAVRLAAPPPPRPPPATLEALRRRRVLIRHFDAPRIRDWLRISIGTPEQMQRFFDALDEAEGAAPAAR